MRSKIQKLLYWDDIWYSRVFEVTDYESELKIQKFEIAGRGGSNRSRRWSRRGRRKGPVVRKGWSTRGAEGPEPTLPRGQCRAGGGGRRNRSSLSTWQLKINIIFVQRMVEIHEAWVFQAIHRFLLEN